LPVPPKLLYGAFAVEITDARTAETIDATVAETGVSADNKRM
jgi:hypothetical protein